MSIIEEFLNKVRRANEEVKPKLEKEAEKEKRLKEAEEEYRAQEEVFNEIFKKKVQPIIDKLTSLPLKDKMKFIYQDSDQSRSGRGHCIKQVDGHYDVNDADDRRREYPSIGFVFCGYKHLTLGQGDYKKDPEGLLDDRQYDADIKVRYFGVSTTGDKLQYVYATNRREILINSNLKDTTVRNTDEIVDCLVGWLKTYAPDRLPELLQEDAPQAKSQRPSPPKM